MLNFKKINKMIDLIEESQIMEGMTFNEFAMEFYSEVKLVPLSRYLKTNNKVKRMPKIMNMRKAGELLLFTKTDDETLSFLKSSSGKSYVPATIERRKALEITTEERKRIIFILEKNLVEREYIKILFKVEDENLSLYLNEEVEK